MVSQYIGTTLNLNLDPCWSDFLGLKLIAHHTLTMTCNSQILKDITSGRLLLNNACNNNNNNNKKSRMIYFSFQIVKMTLLFTLFCECVLLEQKIPRFSCQFHTHNYFCHSSISFDYILRFYCQFHISKSCQYQFP